MLYSHNIPNSNLNYFSLYIKPPLMKKAPKPPPIAQHETLLFKNEKYFVYFFAIFGFIFIYLCTFRIIYSYIPSFDFLGFQTNVPFRIKPELLEDFIYACVFAPIWEELVFRIAPILLLKKLGVLFSKYGIIVMLAVSATFGYNHEGGSAVHVYIQGVVGLLQCWLYIRSNYNWKLIVLSHALYNFMVGFALPFYVLKHN